MTLAPPASLEPRLGSRGRNAAYIQRKTESISLPSPLGTTSQLGSVQSRSTVTHTQSDSHRPSFSFIYFFFFLTFLAQVEEVAMEAGSHILAIVALLSVSVSVALAGMHYALTLLFILFFFLVLLIARTIS